MDVGGMQSIMCALEFFVYALIVWLLTLGLVGTTISYYFDKKAEYEVKKMQKFAEALKKKAEDFGKIREN